MNECIYCGAGSSHLVKVTVRGVLQSTRCLTCGREWEPPDPWDELRLQQIPEQFWRNFSEEEIKSLAWGLLTPKAEPDSHSIQATGWVKDVDGQWRYGWINLRMSTTK